VLAILKARDLDEAFAMANASALRAHRRNFLAQSARHRARAGGVSRGQSLHQPRLHRRGRQRHPFGGFKMSGGGTKAGGREYLETFSSRASSPKT